MKRRNRHRARRLLATEAAGGQLTGKYFEQQRETPCRFAADPVAVEALYAACSRYG